MKVLGKFPQSLGLASMALCRRLFVSASFETSTGWPPVWCAVKDKLELPNLLSVRASRVDYS